MPIPKKKLPTGPIRIEPSVAKRAEVSTLQAADFQSHAEQEDSKAENRKQDSSLVESTKEETPQPESATTETRKQDSGNQDSQKLSDTTLNAMKKESTVQKPVITDDSESSAVISPDSVQSGNAESGLQDSDLPESGLTETEHKKVAMRLSSEAVDKLQKFRANTGVPYEILVEVMIRNWENLPQRTQSSYLQQAKQLRVNRLMAGQEKTLKTMKAKYLQP